MKKRVRAYMRNGRNRRFWRRLLSVLSCVVVFVTTYALLLPAITLEKTAACGMEAHQHDQSCFEQHLICGLEETDGHQHTDDCYTVNRVLTCTIHEHSHTEECFNEEGDLTCALAEHSHDNGCWREDRVLSCEKEETAPHHHTDACYESVLVCRKPVHVHSPECYVERSLDLAQYLSADTTIYVRAANAGDGANSVTDEEYAPGGGGDGSSDSGWLRVDDTAEITDIDLVRLYYAYTIPAGTLTEGNQTLRYALPDNVRLTDDQIRDVNAMNGGRGAQAVEGTRTPDQEQTGNEYVSAWILFENVYKDSDQKHKDPIGQNLVLTFDAATIEKNRKVFGKDGALVDPGEEINGFFSIDINTDQISFDRGGDSDGEKETDVTLVEENKDLGIAPIRRTIRVIEAEEEQAEAVPEILNEEARVEEEFAAAEDEAVVEESAVSDDGAVTEENAAAEEDAVIEEDSDTEENAASVEDSAEEDVPAEEAVNGGEATAEVLAKEGQEDLNQEEQDQEGKSSGEQAADSDKENEEETKEIGRTTVYQGVADTLTFEGADYTVTASFTEDAGIPEGTSLVVSEITEDDDRKAFESYRGQAEEAVAQEPGRKVSWIRLFDITIEKNGKPIEPQGPVSVQITYHEAIEQAADTTVDTVHFEGKKETPRVLETAAEGTDTATEQVSFETDGFSVFAIVGTTIEKNVLASDGKNYKVTVTYGPETGIPVDADLSVEEILPEENGDTNTFSAYEEYVSKTENALGMEEGSTGYIRLFDIKIVDKDTHSVKYQPKEGTVVDVKIELADNESESLSVVHFADDAVEGNKIDAETDGKIVSFEANGFSIYAIVDKDDPQSVARAKIVFQNADGTPFEFLNNAGNTVSNQIIRTGSVLEEVGMPAIDVNGQNFQGWYIYDIDNNAYTSYQLKFGGTNTWTVNYGDAKSITSNTAVVTSENTDDNDCVFYARPYFGEVSYLTFYNESAGDNEALGGHSIILNRIQVIDGTTYDISEQQATPPDSIWNENTQTWEPVSYVFTGWSNTSGTDDDDRTAITNTIITVTDDQSFYPTFKQGHWVTFDSAPTGSGATYIPAKIVLSTQTTSVARPTVTPTWKGHTFVGWFTTPENYDPDNANYYNANGTINPTYNGYFSTNESAAGAYGFNQSLEEDLTLYAHWNVDTANVTVVKWQQVVTDDKNASTPTREQMAADGYASDTSLKHYEYAGQQNLDETVNSILRNNDGDITVPTGFNLNSTLSDAQVVVKDDGTAVLNLYYDRNLITLNFDRDVETHTKTDTSTGTLYGLVGGEYVRITWNGTNWVYTMTEQVTEFVDYTGTRYNTTTGNDGEQWGIYNDSVVRVYRHYISGFLGYDHWSRRANHQSGWGADDQRYDGTRYVQNNNGAYGFVDGSMVQLTNGQYQTTTTQTVEHIYDGDRFTQGTTRSFTGLYGQTLAQNGYAWPSNIGWSYQGYNKNNNGTWSGPTSYSMSYLGQFVVPPNRFNGANDTVTTMSFTSGSATRTIYYYVQNADGTWPGEGGYIDAGLTAAGTIQIAEKFDGFTMDAYEYNNNGHGAEYTASNASWISVSPGESSKTVNDGMAIRYRRLSYTVKFLDSRDGSELDDINSVQVMYGASMSAANPGDDVTITNANTQYVWDGKWYKDQACTEEFNFNDAMPNHDVAVYAGWKEVWYWVKIDPNGGVLPSTEATWFWEPYGGIVEEYHNITRGYVEDEDGAYYYHVDMFDPDTELNQYGTNVRKAEYRLISENPNWEQDSIDGKRYSVDTDNTYSMVGWYKVNDDGTLELYNFSSPVTENLTLRALWRVVGEYHVKYSVEGVDFNGDPMYTMDEEGNPTTDRLLGTNAPSDTNKYADKSSSSIKGAPNPPSGYTFVGWYYNGHVYNPGDTFILDADLADDNKDVWIYPVYLSIEDQPVETTHIPFIGNGGTTTKTDGSDESWAWEVSDEQTKINYVNVQPNVTFDLEESPTYFTRPGYNFVGWGKRTEGQTTTANNFLEYKNGKFYLVGKTTEAASIAADEFRAYEELYALWEPKTYSVTVVKEVTSAVAGDNETPFTFTPSFTGMSGTEYQTNFSLVGKEGGANVTYIDEGDHEVTITYDHSKTYIEIPYGTTFSFTEGSYDNFDLTSVKYTVTDADDTTKNVTEQSSSNGAPITVDGNVTVTFTNVPKTGSLLINKETNPSGIADNDKTFQVTVQNREGKYLQSASDISFGDSAPETPLLVPVSSGLTINNLPADTYTVSELIGTGDDDTSLVDINGYRYDGNEIAYTVESELLETGIVSANSTTVATITNHYTKLVDVTVTKTLIDSTSTGTKEFSFTATLTEDEDNISSYLGTIEEGQTEYAFSLSPSNDASENATMSRVFTGIPVGAVLTVTETNDSDYATTVSVGDAAAASGTKGKLTVSDSDPNNTIEFTNTRKITDIVIKKEDNAGHALPGAEFTLFSLDTSSPTIVSTLKIGETTQADGVISMEDVSEITVSNLASGNYRLVETHAPDGYVILTRGIDFSVDASSGTVTLIKETTETVEGESVTVYVPAEASDYPDASANGNVITVKNTPGAALPNTGGPGTNLIYLLGLMLTGIAGAGLVMRRKRRDAA